MSGKAEPEKATDSSWYIQATRSIYRSRGLGGFYAGLLPTLLRDVPEIAIQFTLYEK